MTESTTTPAGVGGPQLDAALEALRLAVPVFERIISVEDAERVSGVPGPRTLDLRHVLGPAKAALTAARSVLGPTAG